MKALPTSPPRLTMVAALWRAQAPVCICDFTASPVLARATVSHHIARLKEAGLVESEKHGVRTYYRLRAGLTGPVRALLAQLLD